VFDPDSSRDENAMEKAETGAGENLSELFESFDTNKDGLIDEEEFGAIMEKLGWHSPDEVRSLEFAAIDGNADGLVEFEEFAKWWLDHD
jgi:Ca2+-binding EF-hand superfamily protein